MRSEPVTGSTGKFTKREVTLPAPPPTATTLRLGLSARVQKPSEPKGPLQKAFFDDLSLRLGDADVPLVNPGFEAQHLQLNFDPAALVAYRERVAECLEQCNLVLHSSPEAKDVAM